MEKLDRFQFLYILCAVKPNEIVYKNKQFETQYKRLIDNPDIKEVPITNDSIGVLLDNKIVSFKTLSKIPNLDEYVTNIQAEQDRRDEIKEQKRKEQKIDVVETPESAYIIYRVQILTRSNGVLSYHKTVNLPLNITNPTEVINDMILSGELDQYDVEILGYYLDPKLRQKIKELNGDELEEFLDDYDFVEPNEMVYKRKIIPTTTDIKELELREIEPLNYSIYNNVKRSTQSNCVYSYLLSKYTFLKEIELKSIMPRTDLNNISNFCKQYDISLYAIDPADILIHKSISRTKQHKALVFKINNSHIYAIDDPRIRKLVFASDLGDKALFKKYPIDYDNPINYINEPDVELVKLIQETNVLPDALKLDQNGNIISFIHGKRTFMHDDNVDEIKYIIEVLNQNNIFPEPIQYAGQTYTQLINSIINCKFSKLPEGSVFNSNVSDVLRMFNKSAYIRTINEEKPWTNKYGIDRKSSYTDIIYNKKSDWCIYDAFCEIGNVPADLTPGMYYVDCDLVLGFVPIGPSIWDLEQVQYLLDHNIITHDDLKYYVKPRYTIPAQYFRGIVDLILSLDFGSYTRKAHKTFINHLIGSFARTNIKIVNGFITNCVNTLSAMSDYTQVMLTDDYFKCYKIETRSCNNNAPWFHEIIQLSLIKLYELYEYVMMFVPQAHIVGCRNDCIYFQTEEPVDLGLEHDAKNIGDYRLDHYNPVKTLLPREGEEEVKFTLRIKNKQYNLFTGNSTSIQHAINDLLDVNESFCIDAPGGFGKSYLLKNIIREKLDLDATLVTALSNKACLNLRPEFEPINVSNSLQHQEYESNYRYYKRLSKYRTIIIDEFSMLPMDIFVKLYNLKKLYNTQIILLGDHLQICPPTGDNIDYINTQLFKELVNYNMINLEYDAKTNRYDRKTYKMLNNFRENGIIDMPITVDKKLNKNKLYICYLNKTVDRINKHFCNSIEDVHIGQRIMVEVPYQGLIRKQFYIIRSITDDELVIQNEETNTRVTIPRGIIKKHFKLAYAVTADSVQSISVSRDIVIYDVQRMQRRRLYTALSRVKSLNQLSFSEIPNDIYHIEPYDSDIKSYYKPNLTGYIYASKINGKIVDIRYSTKPTELYLSKQSYLNLDQLERHYKFYLDWCANNKIKLYSHRAENYKLKINKALSELDIINNPESYDVINLVLDNKPYMKKNESGYTVYYLLNDRISEKQFSTYYAAKKFINRYE